MAFGAALYMTQLVDPPRWAAPAFAIGPGLAAWFVSQPPLGPRLTLARTILAGALSVVAAAGCGAWAGQVRTSLAAAPRLEAPVGPVTLVGWVEEVDRGATRPRMTIRIQSLEGVARPPIRVRVAAFDPLGPGRAVRCRVVLSPPDPPLTPWGHDPQRRAYFEGVGASGFAHGRCRPIGRPPSEDVWLRATLAVAAWRRELGEAIVAAAPGEGGQVAAALVTGDRSHIPRETEEAYFASGLGHLLSVSGLHMTLVAGFVFTALWSALALIPPLALRAPIKKIAAGAALAASGAYLVISGAEVPAQRAFVMAAAALGAVLLDRPAITMRALALAAVVVIALAPESVLEPGFQMSFAATLALVAAFEAWRRGEEPQISPGPLVSGLRRFEGAIAAALLTSFVAGLAADPIAAFHFQRVTLYGLPANLAAAPLTTFVVAPAAVVAAVAAPFGLADAPLQVMAWGLDQISAVARLFADRPEAVQPLPRMPLEAFLLGLGAGLWAALWRGPVRWLALVPAALAVVAAITAPRPMLLADAALSTIVARTDEPGEGGWRALREDRGGAFALTRLAGAAGVAPERAMTLAAPTGCASALSCAWRTPHGRTVIWLSDPEAWPYACRPGAIVLTKAEPPKGFAERCKPAALISANPRRGGLAFTEQRGRLIIARARAASFDRPWASAQ